jgi:beta-glucosidase
MRRVPDPKGCDSFPPGFLWGTSTAAHQVEGGNTNNDWWEWEQVPGHIKDGTTSGLACDHYRRYPDDFSLLADLGQNAHRFSIEWSRVEPRPGEFDSEQLVHYRGMLESLRDLGLEPVVTLHHFTNPRWLARLGGWARPETARAFERYVERVVREYGQLVRYWITINEPNVYAYYAYLVGEWPPGLRNPRLAFRVVRHMLLAHARAYHVIHKLQPEARVSLSQHLRLFDPDDPIGHWDRVAARLRDWVFNRSALVAVRHGRLLPPLGRGERVGSLAATLDYVGVNHYTREHVAFDLRNPRLLFGREVRRPALRSAFGTEIYPEGLYRALRMAAEFGPVLVTEHGVADENDALRPEFLRAHVPQLARAVADGVQLLGYLHWSSMDNFEWAEGYRLQFGLIAVDRETQARHIKPSAELFARICRSNGATL